MHLKKSFESITIGDNINLYFFSLNVTESSVFVRVGTNKIGYRGQDLAVTNIYLSDSSFLLTTPNDLAMVKVRKHFNILG